MRRVLALAAALTILGCPPATAQQSLLEALANLHFAQLAFAISWDQVVVTGTDMEVRGTTASDLRKCIDHSDCPSQELRQLGDGDANGIVSKGEVTQFAEDLKAVIGVNQQAKDFKKSISEIVTIDDTKATRIDFDQFVFRNAEGPVTSEDPIYATVRLVGEFSSVSKSDQHRITIQRAEVPLDLTNRIVVEPGSHWTIDADSIRPLDMAKLFHEGKLNGAQGDFESTDPLTFSILEKKTLSPWWIVAPILLAAATGAFFLAWRRRQKSKRGKT